MAPPEVATGDGALGFWQALQERYPSTRHQRCWVHETANGLKKLPKTLPSAAKADLHEIWMAASRKDPEAALERFAAKDQAKHPKAVACLLKDRDPLLAF